MSSKNKWIDLNCDLGEARDETKLAIEARVMPFLTSVNIACGFHAGSPDMMRRTIKLASSHGLAIGAHPGFLDREGFGRRNMTLTPAEVEGLVAYQVGALMGVAALEGAAVTHVKPHGALYNLAAQDRGLSDAIARAVSSVDRRLVLVGLAGSHLIESGRALGLSVAQEAFADRAYSRNGMLMPRDLPGAVIHEASEVLLRALQVVRDGLVPTFDGATLPLHADTICLHSDTPQADQLARMLRDGLERAGVQLAPLRHA
jgi:UPF0271 protein